MILSHEERMRVDKTIEEIQNVYNEISLEALSVKSKTFRGGKYKPLRTYLEEEIQSGRLNARLSVDNVVFNRGAPVVVLSPEITEILKDIKDDTELIIYKIEDIFDYIEDLEDYLKRHLGSEFEKIKDKYQEYKVNKLTKKEFVSECIKILGKKFVKIFVKKM